MNKKIIITGATGLIGSTITKKLIERGDKVTVFTRNVNKAKREIPEASEYVEWDYHKPENWQQTLNDKDAVIHLAGASIAGKRWDEEYKKLVMESREVSTKNLVNAISSVENKPSAFICSSAVGYYGNRGNEELTEESKPGDDYLAEVCKVWEKEASEVEKYNVRRVSLRTATVLSTEEGALQRMLTPFKMFIGGPLGNGRQWFPWIHLNDIVNCYIFALDNNNVKGAVNAVAPDSVRMNEFAKTLGKVMNRPALINVPKFAVKIVIGEAAEFILASIKAKPEKLNEYGFEFRFPELKEAFEDLVG